MTTLIPLGTGNDLKSIDWDTKKYNNMYINGTGSFGKTTFINNIIEYCSISDWFIHILPEVNVPNSLKVISDYLLKIETVSKQRKQYLQDKRMASIYDEPSYSRLNPILVVIDNFSPVYADSPNNLDKISELGAENVRRIKDLIMSSKLARNVGIHFLISEKVTSPEINGFIEHLEYKVHIGTNNSRNNFTFSMDGTYHNLPAIPKGWVLGENSADRPGTGYIQVGFHEGEYFQFPTKEQTEEK